MNSSLIKSLLASLAFSFLCLTGSSSHAAIALLDVAGEPGTQYYTSSSSGSAVSSLTGTWSSPFSTTGTAGTDRLMVVTVAFSRSFATLTDPQFSLTYGGQELTLVPGSFTANATSPTPIFWTAAYYLTESQLASAASGDLSYSFTTGGGTSSMGISLYGYLFKGVDQSASAVGGQQANGGTVTSLTTTRNVSADGAILSLGSWNALSTLSLASTPSEAWVNSGSSTISSSTVQVDSAYALGWSGGSTSETWTSDVSASARVTTVYLSPATVPEPASVGFVLLAFGLILVSQRRKRVSKDI